MAEVSSCVSFCHCVIVAEPTMMVETVIFVRDYSSLKLLERAQAPAILILLKRPAFMPT
jgi:hypothetical protein